MTSFPSAGYESWDVSLTGLASNGLLPADSLLDPPPFVATASAIQAVSLPEHLPLFSGMGGGTGAAMVAVETLVLGSATTGPEASPASSGRLTGPLAAARSIGILSGSQSFSDWVGSLDGNDVYRFDLSQANSYCLITLNGLSANADLELLSGTGALLARATSGGSTDELISSALAAGTYFVRVYPFSGDTTYTLTLSATTAIQWFAQNLTDQGLIGLSSFLAADGNLSRNDMISLFRETKDGDLIDGNELTDLRTILTHASLFSMADPVKVLSNKIANGDVANPRSGFGNLYAGSSATQMENLIGKWFLGNDHPALTSTSYQYQYANGSLFQQGISADDINQNALGDCYFLATLSSIALEKPSYIQNMFIDNGDNTYTVRFFNGSVADYLTVDRYLPTSSSGYAVYADWGDGKASSSANKLRETLENPATLRENGPVIAGVDWLHGYQAVWFR